MKTLIEMAHEVYGEHTFWTEDQLLKLKAFADLVRADEREEFQRWFDAVTAQHKAEILAEREACAKVCEDAPEPDGRDLAERIRARGNT
jgi:hypothetical protein